MSYFNYSGLLKYTRGGYIQLAANPKNSDVKFPSAYILVKTAQLRQTALFEECFKVLWSPSLSPSLCAYFKNYFQDTIRVLRREAWRQEGFFEKKTSNRKFLAEGINMHTSISHPFSIKSLNPLSCYHCSLFAMSLLHAKETIFFLGRRREK